MYEQQDVCETLMPAVSKCRKVVLLKAMYKVAEIVIKIPSVNFLSTAVQNIWQFMLF